MKGQRDPNRAMFHKNFKNKKGLGSFYGKH